jgi:predicted ABC-type transport system involved in lysophospholipase L1 biosynthesis ATPase subunit
MTTQDPFAQTIHAEDNSATETWTETKDQKDSQNPFKDALASCCIMEHIKAGLNIAKEAVTQPFELVADVALSSFATLESLKNLDLLDKLEQAFAQLCGLERQRVHALVVANNNRR